MNLNPIKNTPFIDLEGINNL